MRNDQNFVHSDKPNASEDIDISDKHSNTSSVDTDLPGLGLPPIESLSLNTSCKNAETQQGTPTIAPNRRDRNAQAVFDQLPIELVTCILQHCFPDFSTPCRSRRDVADIYRIRLVSTEWRALIEETPWFWFHISNLYPIPVIHDSLRRSKDHPLRVYISQPPGETTEYCENLLLLVQAESHRWRSLDLVTRDPLPEELALSILCSPAPALQTLIAVLPYGQFSHQVKVDLMGGTAHRLKTVQTYGVPIDWNSKSLSNLETVRYAHYEGYSATDAIDLLAGASSLQSLTLNLIEDVEYDDTVSMSLREDIRLPIVAHSLNLLHLNYLPLPTILYILTSVSMPACTSLYLGMSPTSFYELLEVGQGLTQFLPKIQETLRFSNGSTVVVDSNGVYQWTAAYSSSTDIFDFSFSVCGPPMEDFLEWIGTVSAGSPMDLQVEVMTMDFSALRVLGWREEVTELVPRFSDEQGELRSFLEALSTPVSGSDGPLYWVFPRLRKLYLGYVRCEPLDVFSMLNKRYVPVPIPRDPSDGPAIRGSTLDVPPKLQLTIGKTADGAVIRAIKRHWGVESLVTIEDDRIGSKGDVIMFASDPSVVVMR
ncbi:hypothetical protein FRC04_011358 [Tulasnella sp. 424]|nr:hypothetical protein FRC04_011358 [Tulasnella sp. 424]